MNSTHHELTQAGWSYRMNERGWVIYRHPLTGCWHTREEAAGIMEAAASTQIPCAHPLSERSE